MKKTAAGAAALLPAFLMLSGCAFQRTAEASAAIYCVAAVCASVLLAACLALTRGKEPWLGVLFACVAVINWGYYALAVSETVKEALWANRIAYLGSAFLLPAMLMIILKVTGTPRKKWLLPALLFISAAVFLIAATPGWLDIYYKSVTLEMVNGAAVLRKVYGPWHRVYTVYLLGYFAVMIFLVLRAAAKRQMDMGSHAFFLSAAVFVNIGVWLLEQLVDSDFELLSISYIISELFLLGLHYLLTEHRKKLEQALQAAQASAEKPKESPAALPVRLKRSFAENLRRLTPTERAIYDFYLEGKTTKEVMAALDITENTLKFHNKNLYGKMEVSSRRQLIQLAASVRPTDDT